MKKIGEGDIVRRGILLIFVALVVTSCTGYMHGYTERAVRGQVLNAQSGPGKDRLELEMKYDPTIGNYVGEQPDLPDYIYTQVRFNVQLIYI